MLAAFVSSGSASPWSVVSAISNPFNLAAYALAVILILVLRARRKDKPVPFIAWGMVLLLVLIPTGFSLYQEIIKAKKDMIYRVTVLNDRKLPIEETRVWSSIGGEPWLHAEKLGYGGADLHLQAGDEPATLRLKR